jgi:serine/threonine-protein kinase RIO1
VDPSQSEEVYDLLERDVERVYRYFARYGVRANPQALAGEMWRRFLR